MTQNVVDRACALLSRATGEVVRNGHLVEPSRLEQLCFDFYAESIFPSEFSHAAGGGETYQRRSSTADKSLLRDWGLDDGD
jgi:hypothetical protein